MTEENIYELFLQYPEISIDSRQIKEGSLFFALKGESFDGNEFASKAIENGASFAIIDNPKYKVGDKTILVENSLTFLQRLANLHRKHFNIPVLAITGTNGKTTTKELLYAILSKNYKTLATKGNLNNHIGVPLTLLRVKSETEIAIIEMGANHPGEIDALCQIAEPTHGIITNIGKAHLDGFGGFDGVIKAKTELYHFLRSRNGIAFVNSSNSLLEQYIQGMNVVRYNNGESTIDENQNYQESPFLKMKIKVGEQEIVLETKLFGSYNAENISAATSIGYYFKIEPLKIKEAIESYQPQNNRSQVLKTNHNLLILDMYNANPSSMALALQNFSDSAYDQKVLILGDMLELGDESDKEHKAILELIEKLEFNEVYLVGPVFTRLNSKRDWLCFQDSELANIWLEHHRLSNKIILIKGSRGIKLEKLVSLL